MDRKIKWLIIVFVATFLLLNNFILVEAQTVGEIGKSIAEWFKDAFGYTDISASSDWRFAAVLIVIFFMFFFAFSDILYNFSPFSKTTSYILGFGLAVIAVLTKLVVSLSRFLFGLTATLGAFSVMAVIIATFIAFAVIHVAAAKLGIKARKAKTQQERQAIKTAIQELKEIGKELGRK